MTKYVAGQCKIIVRKNSFASTYCRILPKERYNPLQTKSQSFCAIISQRKNILEVVNTIKFPLTDIKVSCTFFTIKTTYECPFLVNNNRLSPLVCFPSLTGASLNFDAVRATRVAKNKVKSNARILGVDLLFSKYFRSECKRLIFHKSGIKYIRKTSSFE